MLALYLRVSPGGPCLWCLELNPRLPYTARQKVCHWIVSRIFFCLVWFWDYIWLCSWATAGSLLKGYSEQWFGDQAVSEVLRNQTQVKCSKLLSCTSGPLPAFWDFFLGGSHPAVFRVYSCLCTQGSFLMGSGEHTEYRGSKVGEQRVTQSPYSSTTSTF